MQLKIDLDFRSKIDEEKKGNQNKRKWRAVRRVKKKVDEV